jgi:hypothetical protein
MTSPIRQGNVKLERKWPDLPPDTPSNLILLEYESICRNPRWKNEFVL